MSRANPSASGSPNPAQRWFEWDGKTGKVWYWDKVKKEEIEFDPHKSGWPFLLLEITRTITGFHQASKSKVFSNEIMDTRTGVMHVRCFKGGDLVKGLYSQIKDRVNSKSVGGHFTLNLYIAHRESAKAPLTIGCMQVKGAALGAWMEFEKVNRKAIWEKAIVLKGITKGKTGDVDYVMPVFNIKDTSAETDKDAKLLSVELDAWLKDYMTRNTVTQVAKAGEAVHEDAPPDTDQEPPPSPQESEPEPDNSDVPF